MRLRYALDRIGEDPGETEIDEALELMGYWQEERAAQVCPFLGT